MTEQTTPHEVEVGVYKHHVDAEEAVKTLQDIGIPIHNISIIGGSQYTNAAAMGQIAPPEFVEDKLQHESERTGIWMGGLFGLLVGFGSFLLPGVGLLMVLGPLTGLAAGVGAGAVIGGISGGLTYNEIAADYRNELKEGSFLVTVHCQQDEVEKVREIFRATHTLATKEYPLEMHSSQPKESLPEDKNANPYSDTAPLK